MSPGNALVSPSPQRAREPRLADQEEHGLPAARGLVECALPELANTNTEFGIKVQEEIIPARANATISRLQWAWLAWLAPTSMRAGSPRPPHREDGAVLLPICHSFVVQLAVLSFLLFIPKQGVWQ